MITKEFLEDMRDSHTAARMNERQLPAGSRLNYGLIPSSNAFRRA